VELPYAFERCKHSQNMFCFEKKNTLKKRSPLSL